VLELRLKNVVIRFIKSSSGLNWHLLVITDKHGIAGAKTAFPFDCAWEQP